MRITYKNAAVIKNYKKPHLFEKYFCNWDLNEIPHGYQLRCRIKPAVYVILLQVLIVVEFLFCAWNTELREFAIQPRELYQYSFNKFDYAFNRAKGLGLIGEDERLRC